jgi:hypothetical protein
MNKRLMLLFAGALTALAFAALPAVASAGEFPADCETGTACSATIAGGHAELLNTNGEGITCTGTSGSATVTSGSSTGTAKLIFTGCRENITPFHFTCTNTATSGRIETNTLTSHNIYIEPEAKTPGILLTGINVTFTCAGFSDKTVTGDIIGHTKNPNCGNFSSSHTLVFEAAQAGHQKYMQVTTTGNTYDLISNNDAGGAYITSSQTGEGTVTYTKNRVKLTC